MVTMTNWGATAEEQARHYPVDDCSTGPVLCMDRAVTVHAPPALTYRWLCQLSLAPYSYDMIDNWGRTSPRRLVPGADELVVGQQMMIFRLTDVRPGSQFTARSSRAERLFGEVALTYAVEPVSANECRLVCRIIITNAGFLGRTRGVLLAWGDLLMMRKQLLTLKKYAERDHKAAQDSSR